MKKTDLLNAPLSGIIASMGHTDKLVVCDSGLPIPKRAEKIDLALCLNIPRFVDTVRVILTELAVEEVVIAEEMVHVNRELYRQLVEILGDIPIRRVPHKAFKLETAQNGNITFVRTGEASPFANIILISGVTFN